MGFEIHACEFVNAVDTLTNGFAILLHCAARPVGMGLASLQIRKILLFKCTHQAVRLRTLEDELL